MSGNIRAKIGTSSWIDKDPNQLDITQAPRGAIGARQLRYLSGNTFAS